MYRRRHELKLSQKQVEEAGGPSQAWQSAAENAEEGDLPKIPKTEFIIRLAKGYGIPVAEVEVAAGLQRGAAVPPPAAAFAEFGEIGGRTPLILSTGDVMYLIPDDDPEPDVTAAAFSTFLQTWRKVRRGG